MPIQYAVSIAILGTELLLLAMYGAGLSGAFFFDDGPSILFAPGVRLDSMSAESVRHAWLSGGAGPSGRPIAQLSFALNYYVSGFSPFAFKATNLAIHGACGVLVFALVRRLMEGTQAKTTSAQAYFISAVVSAFWLLHPIQLLPVLHVVQRMTSLAAFFLLAGMLLHIRGRERFDRAGIAQLLLAWLVMWPLSFFSKETGALFPLFVLAWELIVRRSMHRGLDRFARVFALGCALAVLVIVGYALTSHAQWLWAGYETRGFSLTERVLTESRVMWVYLDLIVAPRLQSLGLYHDDIALSTGLLTPWTTLPALLGLLGLVWLAWFARTRAPLLAFGIAWFLIGHALESTLLPLEIAHEHRNYVPLLGVLLCALWALLHASEKKESLHRPVIVLVGVMLAGFALLTALRAQAFGDELRRALMEVEHHPASARAQHEAGRVLAQQAESSRPGSRLYEMARQHYLLSSELDPAFKMGWFGMIELNCRAGLPAGRMELDELMRRLRTTAFSPGDQSVFYSLKEMTIAKKLCLNRTDMDGLFAAGMANPGVKPGVQAILYSWHADYLWLHEGDLAAARSALAQSLKLNPGNLSNRLKWVQLLMLSGERALARSLLLELRGGNFSTDERNTINELLREFKIERNGN